MLGFLWKWWRGDSGEDQDIAETPIKKRKKMLEGSSSNQDDAGGLRPEVLRLAFTGLPEDEIKELFDDLYKVITRIKLIVDVYEADVLIVPSGGCTTFKMYEALVSNVTIVQKEWIGGLTTNNGFIDPTPHVVFDSPRNAIVFDSRTTFFIMKASLEPTKDPPFSILIGNNKKFKKNFPSKNNIILHYYKWLLHAIKKNDPNHDKNDDLLNPLSK